MTTKYGMVKHRPHPVHRLGRLPPQQAERPDPGAAGALPDPRRAGLAVGRRLRGHPDTDPRQPGRAVPGAAGHRGRDARDHARRHPPPRADRLRRQRAHREHRRAAARDRDGAAARRHESSTRLPGRARRCGWTPPRVDAANSPTWRATRTVALHPVAARAGLTPSSPAERQAVRPHPASIMGRLHRQPAGGRRRLPAAGPAGLAVAALVVTIPASTLSFCPRRPGRWRSRSLPPGLPASRRSRVWWSRTRAAARHGRTALAAMGARPRAAGLGGAAASGLHAGARVPPVRRPGDAGAHELAASPPADARAACTTCSGSSLALLGLGPGFWWLEPRAETLGDGLWLAFTTAATVGYGDIVPTTPASKIFAVLRRAASASACLRSHRVDRRDVGRVRGAPHRTRDPARPAPPVARAARRDRRAARVSPPATGAGRRYANAARAAVTAARAGPRRSAMSTVSKGSSTIGASLTAAPPLISSSGPAGALEQAALQSLDGAGDRRRPPLISASLVLVGKSHRLAGGRLEPAVPHLERAQRQAEAGQDEPADEPASVSEHRRSPRCRPSPPAPAAALSREHAVPGAERRPAVGAEPVRVVVAVGRPRHGPTARPSAARSHSFELLSTRRRIASPATTQPSMLPGAGSAFQSVSAGLSMVSRKPPLHQQHGPPAAAPRTGPT